MSLRHSGGSGTRRARRRRGRPRRTERRRGAVAGWRPSPGPAPPRDPGWAPARRAPDRPVAVECPARRCGSEARPPWENRARRVQRYRPGERAEEPAHLRPSRQLLDADADEDALGGGGRSDEGCERRLSQQSLIRSRRGPAQRRPRRVERDELTAPRSAGRGQSSRPSSRSAFASSSTAASRTMSVPSLVDRNPTARRGLRPREPEARPRFAIESRPPPRAEPDPAHTEHALVSGKAADRVGDARSSTTTCPTRSVVSAALARAMPKPVSRTEPGLAAIRRAATARGAATRRVIPRA